VTRRKSGLPLPGRAGSAGPPPTGRRGLVAEPALREPMLGDGFPPVQVERAGTCRASSPRGTALEAARVLGIDESTLWRRRGRY